MTGIDTTVLLDAELRESPDHERAIGTLSAYTGAPSLVLCPQVISEFLHIVTDPRRFARPLTMPEALARATRWWHAREVRQIHPGEDSANTFLRWMKEHRLGRKRILDTQLAATYHAAGIRRLLTANGEDFLIFGVFDLVSYR